MRLAQKAEQNLNFMKVRGTAEELGRDLWKLTRSRPASSFALLNQLPGSR
jgi:hypothetical protein